MEDEALTSSRIFFVTMNVAMARKEQSEDFNPCDLTFILFLCPTSSLRHHQAELDGHLVTVWHLASPQ